MATSTPNTILMTWLSAAGVPRPRYRLGAAAIRLRRMVASQPGSNIEAEQAAQPGQHVVGHATGVEQRRVAFDGPVGFLERGVEQGQEPFGEVRRGRILGVDGGQLVGAGDPREIQPDAVHDRCGRAVPGQPQPQVQVPARGLVDEEVGRRRAGVLPVAGVRRPGRVAVRIRRSGRRPGRRLLAGGDRHEHAGSGRYVGIDAHPVPAAARLAAVDRDREQLAGLLQGGRSRGDGVRGLALPGEAGGDQVAVRAGFGQAEPLVGGDGQAGPVDRARPGRSASPAGRVPGCPGRRARAATSRRSR